MKLEQSENRTILFMRKLRDLNIKQGRKEDPAMKPAQIQKSMYALFT
jgi:hypothetical protein